MKKQEGLDKFSRQLKTKKSQLTPLQAIDRMKTIYRLHFRLPESLQESSFLFAKDDDQIQLLKIFSLTENLN